MDSMSETLFSMKVGLIPAMKKEYSKLRHSNRRVDLLTQWLVKSFAMTAGPRDLAGFILEPVKRIYQ